MKDEQAFPIAIDLGQRVEWHKGMTLRDYFAAKAMQGLLAQSQGIALGSQAAEYAYAAADAMLRAREAK